MASRDRDPALNFVVVFLLGLVAGGVGMFVFILGPMFGP
jgi:hypothetical protein